MSRQRALILSALDRYLKSEPFVPPEGSDLIWQAFCDLSQARSHGPYGANPISYGEIAAWAALMHVPLRPDDVRTIVAMDQKWRGGRREAPKAALTSDAFDAVMRGR